SLALKYLLKSSRIHFLVGRTLDRNLIYGIFVDDDFAAPLGMWSLVERPDELQAVAKIIGGQPFMLAMFNEAVVNVCSGILELAIESTRADAFIENVKLATFGESESKEAEVDLMFDAWHAGSTGTFAMLETRGNHAWGANQSFYITNQLQRSELHLLD